ncbi:MAG: hypothetical protein CUN56_03020 [Phototrophicales bacterium]|nr:MAG: hypothetical protein CUN56_03020 [Phototrophicales bacterium]RMG72857.1 MAG: hypothetical protein D6711_12200 [Chloroflexota bacterium]
MRNRIALFMLICSLFLAVPVMAQDETPEPTEPPITFEELQALISRSELTEAEIEALIDQLNDLTPIQPTATPRPPTATPAPLEAVQATVENEVAAAIISGQTQVSDTTQPAAQEDDDEARGLGLVLLLLGGGVVSVVMLVGRKGGI